MLDDDTTPRIWQRSYVLQGVTYVPHFLRLGWFVRPGLKTEHVSDRVVTESWLVSHGATPVNQRLWPRAYHLKETA